MGQHFVESNVLILLGFILVFIGFALIMVGVLMPALSAAREERSVEGGAVIIIGPFPIVVASSAKAAKTLVILAIILTLFAVVLFLLLPVISKRLLAP